MSAKAIEGLAPSVVWNRFHEISQIPRPSKHEERIRLYLRNFAGKHNRLFKEDEVGNIVIYVPPKPGFEDVPTVVLQSHIDMVCEKNKDTVHDFSKDPIKLIRDGDWIKSEGTTLGADNGIGVAAALALVTDDLFDHGPIELLFTVDEETGLTGANSLQPGFIEGKFLINLDTEEDGAFYIGCAGGMDTAGIFKIEYEEIKGGYAPYSISVSGLKGGHSGINISDKRANAIKLLGYLLNSLSIVDYQVGSIIGGSKRNAIAREAEAIIFIKYNDEAAVREAINAFSIESVLEFKKTDKEIKITFEKNTSNVPAKVFTKILVDKLLKVIIASPHGVISMSSEMAGLVETSTNLATMTIDNDKLIIGTSQRSSIESAKKNVALMMKSLFNLSGAEIKTSDGYPGWQPNLDSELLRISRRVYKNIFSNTPLLKAVHAGLECGILGDKFPGLDMISIGPTIEGAHSPDEKVRIHDVEKFYRLLKAILEEIAIIK
ncbi:MAG: aminoacyl-histidine dipeptidase [Ignavibacteria bacterium]|nr:aminoacyl-histidine dipeptidase [Ignavibacteria bacterium]